MLDPATAVYSPASDRRTDANTSWCVKLSVTILCLQETQTTQRKSVKGVFSMLVYLFKAAAERESPVRHLQLLTVLHPNHLDVRLRNFTFKGGSLLLRDVQVSQVFGEFNHAGCSRNKKCIIT